MTEYGKGSLNCSGWGCSSKGGECRWFGVRAGEASSILTEIQEIDRANVNTCCNMTNEDDKKIKDVRAWCPHIAYFITRTN